MAVFLITIFLAILFFYNVGKKKKPIQPSSARVRPVQPVNHDPKPSGVSLERATKHFGIEWRKFLFDKSVTLNIVDSIIQKKIAVCYEKLTQKELKSYLASLVNNAGLRNTPGAVTAVEVYNYSALHNSIYRLIVTNKFNENEIVWLLKELGNKQPEVQAKPVQTYMLPPVERQKVTVETSPLPYSSPASVHDNSIIEISQIPVKIEPIVNHSLTSQNASPSNDAYNPEDYKLGTKYKDKLKLSAQEVIWLNKFYDYNNTFNSIEGCSIAIIKLYLLSIKLIVRRLASEPYTLPQRIEAIKEAVYRFEIKQPGYWNGYDYSHHKETAESDLYYTLYKKAEAAVRNAWDHKRKISADYPARCMEAVDLFKKNMEPVMDDVINYLLPTIVDPDDKTEALLNSANTTRWKTRFEKIVSDYKATEPDTLIKQIHTLGRQNRKNPAVENIYYEAAKFFVPIDKTEALRFYLHYIYQDLRSSKIDNKPLNKTVQKSLFKTDEQVSDFQVVVNDLINSGNLERALSAISSIYKTKRKTIVLNTEAIKRVQLQHSDTIEILNEYLNDEDEIIESPILIGTSIDSSVSTASNLMQEQPIEYNGISLNKTQVGFLELFKKSSFNVPSAEIEHFAKENNIFKNQFIDSINDSCYELLDDVLIEEDEDSYQLNPDYYKQIFS
jgi:hypothetical protein